MGKREKKQKQNHAAKVTKIPKTKRGKYWMNKTMIKKIVEPALKQATP